MGTDAAFACRPPVKGGSEPQASGGLVLRLLSQGFLYPRANGFELFPHFQVGEAEYADIECRQRSRSFEVVPIAFVREVAVAIDLNDKAESRAIEVGDVRPERFLPGEFLGQITQEFKPQLAFRGGRIAPKRARRCFKAHVVRNKTVIAHACINARSDTRLTRKSTPRPPRVRGGHGPLDRGPARGKPNA